VPLMVCRDVPVFSRASEIEDSLSIDTDLRHDYPMLT